MSAVWGGLLRHGWLLPDGVVALPLCRRPILEQVLRTGLGMRQRNADGSVRPRGHRSRSSSIPELLVLARGGAAAAAALCGPKLAGIPLTLKGVGGMANEASGSTPAIPTPGAGAAVVPPPPPPPTRALPVTLATHLAEVFLLVRHHMSSQAVARVLVCFRSG